MTDDSGFTRDEAELSRFLPEQSGERAGQKSRQLQGILPCARVGKLFAFGDGDLEHGAAT